MSNYLEGFRVVTSPDDLDYSKTVDKESGELIVSVIAVDIPAMATQGMRAILMQPWANRAAVEATLTTGIATFWSRSRQCLWVKGETSNNYLRLRGAYTDCDGDTLLLNVRPMGPACHTGMSSCFEDDQYKANSPVQSPKIEGVRPELLVACTDLEQRFGPNWQEASFL